MFIISFALLLLFTNPFIGDEAFRAWEKPIAEKITSSYSTGVLLGGDIVTYDKAVDRLIFRSGSDRLLQTIDLYQNGIIKKIIISGGSGHLLYKDRTEASFVKKYLTGIGIRPEDVMIENKSRNTFENAKYTARLLKENNISDTVVLITSALHMRRAAGCFRKQSVIIKEYPTSKITGNRVKNFDHLFIPSIRTLEKWKLLIHELVGQIMYKVLGYN